MKRLFLALPILVALLLPSINAYAWVVPPYSVTQLVDLNTGVMWTIVGEELDFIYATDNNFDGFVDAFAYVTEVISHNGEYYGEAYVEVNFNWGYIYIELYVNIDGTWVYLYYDLYIIHWTMIDDGVFIYLGYYPGDPFLPPSVVSGFAFVPFPFGGRGLPF